MTAHGACIWGIARGGRYRIVWGVSLLGSALLIAPILVTADWRTVTAALRHASGLWLIAAALLLLALEGVFASLRLRLFARQPSAESPPLRRAFEANAFYVLGVSFLPARLGEGVGVLVTHRMLGLSAGAAAISILAQRLFDLLALAGMILPIVVLIEGVRQAGAVTASLDSSLIAGAAVAVVAVAVLGVWRPGLLLTPIATCAHRRRTGSGRLMRGAVRLIMQARLWGRHVYPWVNHRLAVTLTLGKWFANVGALCAVLITAKLGLEPGAVLIIAGLYNFLLAVPIPTVGGVGLAEAGLTTLLTIAGAPVAEAAAASLLVRLVMLAFPLFYAGATWGLLALSGAGRGR